MNYIIRFYENATFMEGAAVGLLLLLVLLIVAISIPHKDEGPW